MTVIKGDGEFIRIKERGTESYDWGFDASLGQGGLR